MRSAADPTAPVGGTQEVTHNARRHCGNSTVIKIAKQRIYHFEGKEERGTHQLWNIQTAAGLSQRTSGSGSRTLEGRKGSTSARGSR